MQAYGRKYLMSSEINGTDVYVDHCEDCDMNGHVIRDAVEFRSRFNTVPYHMRPMARNLIDNGIYRYVL